MVMASHVKAKLESLIHGINIFELTSISHTMTEFVYEWIVIVIIIIINTVFVYAISPAIKPFRGALQFTWIYRLPKQTKK